MIVTESARPTGRFVRALQLSGALSGNAQVVIATLTSAPGEAGHLLAQGASSARRLDDLAPLFRRAQAGIERRHFRQRRILMYHEKERRRMQIEIGQDPYLDTPP